MKKSKETGSSVRIKAADLSLWEILGSLTPGQWIACAVALAALFSFGVTVGDFWDTRAEHARQIRVRDYKLRVAHMINGYWSRDPVILKRLEERRASPLPSDEESVDALRVLLKEMARELSPEDCRDFARVWQPKAVDRASGHGEILLSSGLGPATVPSGLRPKSLNDSEKSDDI